MTAGALICALALAPSAEASPYWFWSDHPSPGYTEIQPAPRRHHHHKRPQRHQTKLEKQIEKQTAKPQGPVVIAVSIEQQKLKVYDSTGLFAETPVSTGMRGHATPMGVFSIIQKHKYHRSNIYSGAPMPYMQRITWSGVAMHAGVLPGYPASHGCIRMPMAFAVKLWGWTRMGARVIVAPGAVMPASFSHPLLIARKPTPEPEPPMASDHPPPPAAGTKSDKAAATDAPAAGEDAANSGLRPGIAAEADAPAKPTGQVRTADARGGVTLTDAAPDKPSTAEPAAAAATVPSPAADAHAEATSSLSDTTAATGERPDSGADTAAAAKPADLPVAAASPPTAPAADQPTPANGSATDTADAAEAKDPVKDQSRASEAAPPKPALSLPAPKPTGQIAAFVSGKDGKLYVRQNQTPLFDIPVTIASSVRPLGTHVFTAEMDKDNNVRWTVTSLPASRKAERSSEQRKSRHQKNALAEDVKATPETDSPAEALSRLTIAPEAMTRIAEALASGGSLIVSDQGIAAGETGEGTDFIIRLR